MKQLDLFSAPPSADKAGQASRAFPFRTVLHHAPPEAIDAANEIYVRKGIMRIEPVDEGAPPHREREGPFPIPPPFLGAAS